MTFHRLAPATALLLALSGCADPSAPATGTAAVAPASDWDGTWKGSTGRNSPVEIDVRGGRATSYSFRGTPFRVTDSSLSGETMTVRIIGGDYGATFVSTITLTRTAPGAADFTFAGPNNSRAAAKMTRT